MKNILYIIGNWKFVLHNIISELPLCKQRKSYFNRIPLHLHGPSSLAHIFQDRRKYRIDVILSFEKISK